LTILTTVTAYLMVPASCTYCRQFSHPSMTSHHGPYADVFVLTAPLMATITSDTPVIHPAPSTTPRHPSSTSSLCCPSPSIHDDSQSLSAPAPTITLPDSTPLGYFHLQRKADGPEPDKHSPRTHDSMTPTSSVPLYSDLDSHSNRRISRLMQKCYGQSSDGNTRVSLHSAALPLSQTIRSLLQGARRDEASVRLQQHACFHYWKRIDYTHYSNSIPNGACLLHILPPVLTSLHDLPPWPLC
jgi:hypothetical protein